MSSVPILRELSPFGRIVVLVTLAMSVLGIAMEYVLGFHGTALFVVSAAAILGLAYVVGLSTERLGAITGPQVGGILNATFGNIAELIIAFFALQAGLIEVVKASITGSIIGNLLLVLGASLFFGGLRNGTQKFNARLAGLDSTLLFLAVIGLLIPATFASSAPNPRGPRLAGAAPGEHRHLGRADGAVRRRDLLPLPPPGRGARWRERRGARRPAVGDEDRRGRPARHGGAPGGPVGGSWSGPSTRSSRRSG